MGQTQSSRRTNSQLRTLLERHVRQGERLNESNVFERALYITGSQNFYSN